jgi:hypothetical protein
VPDLGQNKIWRLAQSGSSWYISGSIPQPAGSGPRHIAIAGVYSVSLLPSILFFITKSFGLDNNLYTLHELSSTLTAQPVPSSPNGTSTITASVSIVPSDAPSGSSFAAAEILIPPTSSGFPTVSVSSTKEPRSHLLISSTSPTFTHRTATPAMATHAEIASLSSRTTRAASS